MAAGKLIHHHHGKARIRVLKLVRNGTTHHLQDVEIAVMLAGDFEASFTHADNKLVVPTDNMKNTVQVLALDQLETQTELFAIAVGRHFLARYSQVREATVEVVENSWQRLEVDGQPHPHSFSAGGTAKPFTRVYAQRDRLRVESGIRDLLILKSTASGFAGFPRDEFTTLPETSDRILATNLQATWTYSTAPGDYTRTRQSTLDAMLNVFAVNYSPSVQATLHQMAEAALIAAPEISQVTLSMPNQHCLLVNLAPFGRENPNVLFTPTTEPHGLIEATLTRA
jgi:urate oxidase